ncbi:MAG: permease-like cell division protein FtsX [Pseudomonadales bacterium]|nr:permease-like cell division protein FtsX [Pseudomonadales bacterium]
MPNKSNRQSKAVSGASTHTHGIADKTMAYIESHRTICLQTLGNLCGVWLTSLMTWMVIGIALALPTILYVLLANIGNLGGGWDGKPRISLYLVDQIEESRAKILLSTLAADADFESVRYISSADALDEFQRNAGMGDILASLPMNPLPIVIELEPAELTPAELKLKVLQLETMVEVDSISVDLEWIERLFALLALGERFVATLGAFLGLGVLLAIGNTIRLAIENRRAEIEIIKLVGGTDRYVRRPFLYLGFWYGFGGALVAWSMIKLSLLFLSGPVETLLHSYQEVFTLQGLDIAETLALMFVGSLLGIIGAALAVGRHLHQIKPG